MRGAGVALVMALVLALVGGAGRAAAQEVTGCDRLAGFVGLPRIEGAAGVHAIADPEAALRACEAAVVSWPGEPWFRVLLARVLLVIDAADPRALRELGAASEALPALVAWRIGQLYEFGLGGLPPSERSARDRYREACDRWPQRQAMGGCTALAVMMIEGRGGPVDEPGGFGLLDHACRTGWGTACLEAAFQIDLRGDGDPEAVAALFEAGCAAGDLLACSQLGYRHETGFGVALDMARAADLYRQACDGGEPEGCSNLGEVYRSGLGVRPDIGQAVALFERACAGHDAYACATLGFLLVDGRGVPVDEQRARAAFEAACALGDPEGCDMADSLR